MEVEWTETSLKDMAQALIQAGNGIVLQPGFVGPHQAAVFRVENEDHAHERGEQAAVNVAGVVPQSLAENVAPDSIAPGAVGLLKAANQFVQRARLRE
jgi:hypothetical protein